MKLETFKKLFPNADMLMFSEVEGVVVYDKLDDVEEPSFWDNPEGVFDLHLPYDDLVTYYQNKQKYLEKVRLAEKKVVKKTWQPEEFGFLPEKSPPVISLKTQNFDFENFRIYVSPNEFFVLKKRLEILNFSNISKIDFSDDKNVYCLGLKAMYVLSYLSGMSTKNLQSENNLAKSLSYFFFYYHLNKFYNYRNFSQYNTKPVEEEELFQSLYYWTNHKVYYHSKIHYTKESLKKEKDDVVQKIKRDGKWIRYQTRGKKRDLSKDYLKLIQTSGKGLTRIGQILFQESCQAYVYCVLGAQAKTRWKIIGDGANSYQTQNVFVTLVDEIVKQNNVSTLIKSMRLAINETKVRLDFCISPGLELLPSQMVYIKDSPGYNNVLLISNKTFKFGSNSSVNSTEKRLEAKTETTSEEIPKEVDKKLPIQVHKDLPGVKTNNLLIGSAFAAFVLRYIWLAL